MKSRYFVAFTILLGALLLVVLSWRDSPQAAFRELLVDPIPASVHSIRSGTLHALDSSLTVLAFAISSSDLQTLLEARHFSSIEQGDGLKRWDTKVGDYVRVDKTEFFERWRTAIRTLTGMQVDITPDWNGYVLHERSCEHYMFCDPTSTAAVLVVNCH